MSITLNLQEDVVSASGFVRLRDLEFQFARPILFSFLCVIKYKAENGLAFVCR